MSSRADQPRKPSQHGAAIFLSLLLLALPVAGVSIGNRLFDQESAETSLTAALLTGAILCVGVWIAFPTVKAARSLLRRPATFDAPAGVESPALLRAILAEHDLPCPRCKYNLRGLTEPTCPECHEPIRVHVTTSEPSGPSTLLICVSVLGVLMEATILGMSVYELIASIGPLRGSGLALSRWLVPYAGDGVLALIGVTIIAINLVAWFRAADRRRRTLLRWRILRVSVWVLALHSLFTLSWWGYEIAFGWY